LVDGARGPGETRAGTVADAAGSRRAAVQERGSRLPAHLVGGRRRSPEPHVPRAAGPGQRPALLAPEGDRDAPGRRRALRGHLRGHEPLLRGLSRVARQDTPRARARQSPPPALATPGVQARRERLPTLTRRGLRPRPTVVARRSARSSLPPRAGLRRRSR